MSNSKIFHFIAWHKIGVNNAFASFYLCSMIHKHLVHASHAYTKAFNIKIMSYVYLYIFLYHTYLWQNTYTTSVGYLNHDSDIH